MNMVRIDIHLHTSRYSSCSKLSPEHLVVISGGLPIQAVVITEHDCMWAKEELEELQNQVEGDFRFFRAVEVSTTHGHVLAYSLRDSRKVSMGMPLEDLARMAQEDNAALVLAHPGRSSTTIPENHQDYWERISAVEVMSNNITELMIPQVRQTVLALKKPTVAGSDGHVAEISGLYATLFPQMPADETELAQMIINGLGVPWANENHIRDIRKQFPERKILSKNPMEDQNRATRIAR